MDALTKKQLTHRIANRIKDVRTQKSISQGVLAEATGFDQAILSRYESAQATVSLDAIIRLADGLGCSIDYLLGRDEGLDITSDRGRMLAAFEQLPPAQQEFYAVILEGFVGSKK